jgi:hypothetical protein
MKEIKATIMLILCLACLAVLGNTSVRAYNVGVSTGYLEYDVNFLVNASGQSYSERAQITVNITSVTATMIEGTIEVSNVTGSLPTGFTLPISPGELPFSINTTTWAAPYSSTTAIIIPAGLEVGDSVPGDGTVQNLTGWNGRTAVVINASESLGLPGSAEFDDATGVFLEASGSTNVTTYSIKLTDTSLFSVTPTLSGVAWWFWAILVLVIVGAIVGTALLTRRRRQPVVQPSATPSPSSPQPPAKPTGTSRYLFST